MEQELTPERAEVRSVWDDWTIPAPLKEECLEHIKKYIVDSVKRREAMLWLRRRNRRRAEVVTLILRLNPDWPDAKLWKDKH